MKYLSMFLFLLLFSCDKKGVDILKLGNWGTDHARLTVQANSWAIEFDCAHATVNDKVTFTDRKFEASAEYFRETGVQLDDPEFYKAIPSKVSGELLKNGNLQLTIFVGIDLENYGTYTFSWNQEARVYKCA